MRKSERIRQLELQMVALDYELKYVKEVLSILVETSDIKEPDLDSGKWYNKKSDK
jgi:hypothetical protein